MRKLPWLLLLLAPAVALAFPPAFHLPLDGSLAATSGVQPLTTAGTVVYMDGRVGPAGIFPAGALATYPTRGALDKARGSACFWLCPDWDGDDGLNHGLIADVSDFNDKLQNTFYLWKWSTGQLRLDLRCPSDPYLTYDVSHWQKGQWHHIGATWDAAQGLALFVDGECVARRAAKWDVVPWPQFNVGGDWANNANADATFDDVRIYPVVLQAAHFRALMRGLPLEEATITKVRAPAGVRIGKPFVVKVQALAPTPLTRDYPLVVELDGTEIAQVTAQPDPQQWTGEQPVDLMPVSVTVPTYLRIVPHKARLTARLQGTVTPAGAKPAEVDLWLGAAPGHVPGHEFDIVGGKTPRRDKRPFPPTGQGEGFLYEGVFYANDAAGRTKAIGLISEGRAQDALPCRLVDSVDCARDDHGFRQWGQSVVRDLGGQSYRLTGAPETATEKVTAYNQERPTLPGFCYTLATTPLPVPHVLVAELANDRERYNEIAIDAAPGSRMAAHLAEGGPGSTRLIDLVTVYTGREYRCDGGSIRHSVVFYPKSDACEVTVTSSSGERMIPETSAAVARLSVYRLLDEDAALHNEVPLPQEHPQRTASLFFPWHEFMYTQWGFSGQSDQQRRASLLSLFDHMKLMGLNRLEFHPVAFGMNSYYNGGELPNAATYDVFDDVLPLAEERGIEVVPCLDGMAFYDKFAEFTRDSFQLDKDGKTLRNAFGDVPDPLRPEVQARLTGFMSEFLDKTRGYKCVPFVSFKVDGKMGTCYSGDAPGRPPEDAGYSEWNVQEFQKATGATVGGTAGDAASRHAALRADTALWEQWSNWRCEETRELWQKTRDLAVSRGNQLLVKTILPSNFPGRFNDWKARAMPPLEVLRAFGYDPRMYAAEKGMRITRSLLVGADRYFGEDENKTYQYDDQQAGLYGTAEGAETELYFVYWELPFHPRGFRVGPSSGPGRAFFEPLTYTLRMHNPYNLGFYNWYAGTSGHELELRRFMRAYRALPAVPGTEFAGEVFPRDPRIAVRWHGDRLAVINDTGQAVKVRLNFPEVFPRGTQVLEVSTGRVLSQSPSKSKTRIEVPLEPWDLATVQVVQPPKSSIRKEQ